MYMLCDVGTYILITASRNKNRIEIGQFVVILYQFKDSRKSCKNLPQIDENVNYGKFQDFEAVVGYFPENAT